MVDRTSQTFMLGAYGHTNARMKKISFIIPCYNEEKNIVRIYSCLNEIVDRARYICEFIYVDNNSSDDSERVFRQLASQDERVYVLLMSRNFGSPQSSYLAGLEVCKGDAAILIAGDMEDPPEYIPKFLEKWNEGYHVVYGVRRGTKMAPFTNFFYSFFYWLFKKMSYITIPLNAGDFCLLDREVINHITTFHESDFYLRGIRAYVGFKQVGIDFIREPRRTGVSSTGFFKNIWWAKTIIINFSLKPLEWISKIAFLVVLATCVGIIANLVLYFLIPGSPPGIPTIVILILFLGGIQLLGISIIGEYLAKIFIEIKHRPRYIIKEVIGAERKAGDLS